MPMNLTVTSHMGLIKGRLRRNKEPTLDEIPQPTPEPIAPIKRYRVQSMPAQKPQLQYSRSVCSHKDDFHVVTEAWKRSGSTAIRILEPSEASLRSDNSLWSAPSLESQLEVKKLPHHPVVGNASPTFSLCGSEISPSPSLDYSGSVSSNSSGWSYQSSLRSQPSVRSQRSMRSQSSVDAGIPPLLPAHRTFSGNPHYGSFCKQRKAPDAAKSHARTASDYIPVHVFTRECKQPERLQIAKRESNNNVSVRPTSNSNVHYEKRFSLNGYAGGLKVVNTTPPSSPLPLHQQRQPVRYRVPSKASLMDH